MKINCLACGHKVELDDAYGDYEGPVKCFVCSALLEVKTEQGNIKSVNFLKITQHLSAEEALEPVR